MKPSFPRIPAALFAFAALALAAGCAQDLDEVNRVQPNYVKKAELQGREYYVRQTVVGTQFTSGYSFPGAMGSAVRGVFEIQEKTLFFYRTYEFIQGSEATFMKGDTDAPVLDKDGEPVEHAALLDYSEIRCEKGDPEGVCKAYGAQGWCADAANPQLPDEADHHGLCVVKATRYAYRGAPVFAFPIDSHFDIQYDYNTGTGEKTNVKVENTTDRKWYDREYMRVSWGAGWAANYEARVLPNEGVAVFEGDTAPEGEKFEMGVDHRFGEDVPQQYITFMTREISQAPTLWSSYYGAIPLCYFYPWYTGGVYDCISEETKVRTFFLEVPDFSKDPELAYVPRPQDDVEFEKFGFFRSERLTYDPQYGKTFDNAIRYAQRHRIWDRYVKKMDKGEDGVSRWTGELDYSKMNPVPIVYYMNKEHPRELVEASKSIAAQWSKAFEDTVAFHKGSKPAFPMFILCENNDAIAKAAADKGLPVAEWSGTDLGAKFCREMDKERIFGDLRYSMMHAVTDPIQIGLYGYGPSAADPLTGEILAASAHSYVAQMKRGAERAMRTIEFHAGIKDFNDIKDWSEQIWLAKAKAAPYYDSRGPKTLLGSKVAASQTHAKRPRSTKEAQDYVRNMIDPDVRQALETEGLQKVDNAGTWAQGRMQILRQNPVLDAMLVSGDDSNAVPALFKYPALGNGASAKLPDKWLDQMSLAQWAHTAGLRARENVRMRLAKKNLYLEEFADAAVLGLANKYGRRFDKELCEAFAKAGSATIFDWDKLLAETPADVGGEGCKGQGGESRGEGTFESMGLAKGRVCVKTDKGVAWAACSSPLLMHKLRLAVSAAIGQHPFAEKNHFLPSPLYTDTADALVSKTQRMARDIVLALRKDVKVELWSEIYRGTQLHEVGHTLGLRHNFEASTDAMNFHKEYWGLKLNKAGEVANPWQRDTAAQSLGNIREKQLASVMDYTAKFNGRWAGLGLYDIAAIKFGYGDIVEVFAKPPVMDKPVGKLPPMKDFLEEPSDTDPGNFELLHLGNQDMLRLTRKIHYSALPAYFNGVANIYDRVDISWKEIKGKSCVADADCGADATCKPLGDKKFCAATKHNGVPIVEVPYRFCSDEYSTRTPTCATFDEGADALEIARNALDDYENYWFFYGYARDSETFHPNRYAGTVARYFYTAFRQFQYWAMNFAHYQKNGWYKEKFGVDYDVDPLGGLSGAVATSETFNVLAQVISRPNTAYYCWNSVRERYEPYAQQESGSQDDCTLFTELDGTRPLYGGWSFSGYLSRPVSGGQFYDRLTAFGLLTDPTPPDYVNVLESEDTRRYLAGFFNFFPRQVMNMLSGISVENPNYFGWCVLNGGKVDGKSRPDHLMRRHWIGGDAQACPAACRYVEDDPTAPPLDQQPDCTKYRMFPDRRPTFPSSRFRMPLLASLYGMSMLVKGFNRSFLDISRVFLKGNKAAIDLSESVTKCEFTDPLSGKIYVAYKASDDVLNTGCLQLEEAQKVLDQTPSLSTLQDNYLFSEYQFRVSLIDIIRTMHETYEY